MDSFFGIGIFELIMIAVIALVVLGPERLPGAMREVAKYMKQLRNISNEFQSQFSEELKMLEEIDPRRILNEAIDPNTPANTTAATTKPVTTAPATSAVKPPATASAATAATAAVAAAKPIIPKPVAPPAAPAAPAITNGEPTNMILPPNGSAVANESSPPASGPPPTAPESEPTAPGASTPTSLLPNALPPADVDVDGHQPPAAADPGAEASQ